MFIFLLVCNLLLCQTIPNEFEEFYKRKLLTDSGKNWDQNSIFGPPRLINSKSSKDSLTINSRFGIQSFNKARALYGYGHFTYKNNFHGYLYSRIVNYPDSFERYSGIQRDISRYGFTSGETDQSGICFENGWLIFQFGRGRESWGAGNNIQLGLSENSNSYDYGMLDLDFGNLKVRYFNGYLETDSLFVSRYITGRGIEWNNKKNFLLALSEVVIYSGKNRALDFSYLNPISTHLEIELNDKQNDLGTDSGNGIWQLSMDYLFRKSLRFSFNYLIDEFVLDRVQKDANKNNEGGYSLKILYASNILSNHNLLNFYFSTIKIGTNTFRHEDGNNNFVVRGKPLGWNYGSDGRELKFGLNLYNDNVNMLVNAKLGRRDLGINNLTENVYSPYVNYYSNPFPSGDFSRIFFLQIGVQWWYKPYLSFAINFDHEKDEKNDNQSKLELGFDIYFPLKTKI